MILHQRRIAVLYWSVFPLACDASQRVLIKHVRQQPGVSWRTVRMSFSVQPDWVQFSLGSALWTGCQQP